ncbi:MAG: DUF1643 domain-containing protein [Phormidesmis sp.]
MMLSPPIASVEKAAEKAAEKAVIERTAVFDRSQNYRYWLGRRWQKGGAQVAFVMLNPSRADDTHDDPTLRACIQFAQRWEYSALSVVNLFGYRTPHPAMLKKADNPVGPQNDEYVLKAVTEAQQVVLAWGNWGSLGGRDRAILTLLRPHQPKLTYLQMNRSGQPRHPLYISRDRPLRSFTLPAS